MTDIYRVRIKGHLDSSWAEWFDGLTITHQADGTTLLIGPISDQPALHGLMARINNLGLPILLVEQINQENDSD